MGYIIHSNRQSRSAVSSIQAYSHLGLLLREHIHTHIPTKAAVRHLDEQLRSAQEPSPCLPQPSSRLNLSLAPSWALSHGISSWRPGCMHCGFLPCPSTKSTFPRTKSKTTWPTRSLPACTGRPRITTTSWNNRRSSTRSHLR